MELLKQELKEMDNKFAGWGIKVRKDIRRGYYSIWENLITTRLKVGKEQPLEDNKPEFIDCCINTKCNSACPFCYVAAGIDGINYKGICETWKDWMNTFREDRKITNLGEDEILKELFTTKIKEDDDDEPRVLILKVKLRYLYQKFGMTYTEKPFQIAIGGTGEPTIHPDFCEFLETVYNTGVVPNYTTNGIVLSDREKGKEILEATSNFCGGVAVSYGNKEIRGLADKAIENLLLLGNCKVMIHHLISDRASVDEMILGAKKWGDNIKYHVLLPLMNHGRCKNGGMKDDGTFQYMAERLGEEKINYAVGANFLPYLKKYPGLIDIWDYPNEYYSKNVILQDKKIIITRSSYKLEPIKEICL